MLEKDKSFMQLDIKLSNRIGLIQPSSTLAITALANKLKDEGESIINFGAGEPDFDTPNVIKESAHKALQQGYTKYSPVPGLLSLRKMICKKLQQDNGLSYTDDQINVGVGAKQILYNLFMVLVDPGDEVVFSTPYWVSYYDMVLLAEGKPKIIQTTFEDNYKIKPQQLETSLTSKTKVFVINSPSNPSGVVYTKSELEGLAKVLQKYPQVCIISDDIYEKCIYDDLKFYNLPMVASDLLPRTIIVNGFSKAFAMTGWRLGYAASHNKAIIKAISKMQGQSTSGATTFVQKAGETALAHSNEITTIFIQTFLERRDKVMQRFNEMGQIRCVKPNGAFYVFPSLLSKITSSMSFQQYKKDLGEDSNSKAFTAILLRKHLVAVVPGIDFGVENAFRISYATSMEDIETGLERIEDCLNTLSH